jgi:hypothetical protein
MYSKPEVIKLSHAVDAIQKQSSSTKTSPLFHDVLVIGQPINQSVTASAYEADE